MDFERQNIYTTPWNPFRKKTDFSVLIFGGVVTLAIVYDIEWFAKNG